MSRPKRTSGRTTPRKVKSSRPVRPPKGNEQHPQVRIAHNDQTAEVDEEIADLILACWRAGIQTARSCQGRPSERPWVCFDPEALKAFVFGLVPENDEFVTKHVFGCLWPNTVNTSWRYQLTPDWAHDYEAPAHSATGIVLLSAVFFPRSDIPEIIRRLDLLELPMQ